MDEPRPTRPWWKRARWRLALAAWALAAYPASLGPAKYLLFRDFTPARPFAALYRAAYAPLFAAARGTPLEPQLDRYEGWWALLAAEHDGRAGYPDVIPPYPREGLPE